MDPEGVFLRFDEWSGKVQARLDDHRKSVDAINALMVVVWFLPEHLSFKFIVLTRNVGCVYRRRTGSDYLIHTPTPTNCLGENNKLLCVPRAHPRD